MNYRSALAALDRALAANGQLVTLRRYTGSVAYDVTCLGLVRGEVPDERPGDLVQDDLRVIVSASPIVVGQWPGPRTNAELAADKRDWRVPTTDDQILIAGRWMHIEEAMPVYLQGELVRIEMRVRG